MRIAGNVVTMAVLVGALMLGMAASARADGNMLTVTQDESSMERVIEQYLKDAHQITLTEKTLENNDLVLIDEEKGDPMPGYRIMIDTESVAKPADGKVTERAVTVQLYTGVKVPADKRADVLQAINEFTSKNWFFAAYVDQDDEIALQWSVNVMSQGLHAEYVYDGLVRVNKNWQNLWPSVAKALE